MPTWHLRQQFSTDTTLLHVNLKVHQKAPNKDSALRIIRGKIQWNQIHFSLVCIVMENSPPSVTVYWRPGCLSCVMLRDQLDQAGVSYESINIWENAEASAKVRSIDDGNETVPTVTVGDVGLVNPSANHVISLIESESNLN